MGSDNLFHKRRARKADSLKRTKARRSPYDTVLIVCEGGKTEPNYFAELREDLKLNTANIKITGESGGSAPINVVNYALKNYLEYDKVFCVFDKDTHPTYQQARDKVKNTCIKKGHEILAVTSVPCFEFWILLHFEYTTKQFDITTGSVCERAIKELKKYLQDYSKGDSGLYRDIKQYLSTAIDRAKRVLNYCDKAGTDHPSAHVHELVLYLQALKKGY